MWVVATAAGVLLGLLHSEHIWADDLVALVDLKFLEATDETAEVLCFGEGDSECGVWATFYLGEAHIQKVISGTAPSDRFLVLYRSHALAKRDFPNLVARFVALEPDAYGNAKFQMHWGDQWTLACFDDVQAPDAPIELKERNNDALKCYEMRGKE
jgi:hypothetical protein